MRITALRRFTQFINDMLRRRLIRVTHTEVNNILTARSRSSFQFVNDIEDIGWQTLDALEIGVQQRGSHRALNKTRNLIIALTTVNRLKAHRGRFCSKKIDFVLPFAHATCRRHHPQPLQHPGL